MFMLGKVIFEIECFILWEFDFKDVVFILEFLNLLGWLVYIGDWGVKMLDEVWVYLFDGFMVSFK